MTKKQQDRADVVKRIQKAAVSYKKNLVGKHFLYVFGTRHIEVIYKKENFLHLTGVDTELSAKQFFNLAVKGYLGVNQIGFSAKHPYSLCIRKVQHLNSLSSLVTEETFMLERISTASAIYKFGTTDLNFTLCMNDRSAGYFFAQSLRDEDCFSKCDMAHVVDFVFSRPNDAKEYTEILYPKAVDARASLPEDVKCKLSPGLVRLLSELECA